MCWHTHTHIHPFFPSYSIITFRPSHRHKKVQALKAKSGFASDDWTLYDHYEDDAFVDEKEGFQVQENPYVGHQKDMKIKNVLSGIKGLKVGKEEVTADDVANFEETMDQLGHFEFDDDDTKPLS